MDRSVCYGRPVISIVLNGKEHACPAETTVAQLLSQLALPPQGIAVAIDRIIVPAHAFATRTVMDGARVDIVRAVAGG